VEAHDVAAGVHGQTVRATARRKAGPSINNPARVAGAYMTVVADFRMRDIAAGGQECTARACVPRAMFSDAARHRVIANLRHCQHHRPAAARPVRGFDTGPGNVLLDLWCSRHRNAPFDAGGAFAASGGVDARLFAAMLAEPYFGVPPPKSTGRDLFNAQWLDRALARTKWAGRGGRRAGDARRVDARTLTPDAVRAHCEGAQELLVCGGGAKNADLMRRIGDELGSLPVAATDAFGIASDHVYPLSVLPLYTMCTVKSRCGTGSLPASGRWQC
jgi:anhydro-N-acetylmuramic acid kinase